MTVFLVLDLKQSSGNWKLLFNYLKSLLKLPIIVAVFKSVRFPVLDLDIEVRKLKIFDCKGQLISECLLGVIDFPKKQPKI